MLNTASARVLFGSPGPVCQCCCICPTAVLLAMQVQRLRPKGADECRFETEELLGMVQHLQVKTFAHQLHSLHLL